MATCSKCFKQIPDDAVHCGFCGAARNKPKEKKTLFGYSSLTPEALAKEQELQRQTRSSAEVASVVNALADTSTSGRAAAGPDTSSQQNASSSLANVSSEAFEQTLMAAPPLATGDPGVGASAAPSSYQPTLAAPASLPIMGAPGPGPASVPATPAAAPGNVAEIPSTLRQDSTPIKEIPPTLRQDSTPKKEIPPTIRQDSAPRQDSTAKVEGAYKPVLASQSLAEELAPREPGKTVMRITMFLSSILLLGIFCSPDASSGSLVFSWDILSKLEGLNFIKQIYFVGGGVVLFAGAILPLPYLLRAAICVLFGLFPLGAQIWPGCDWQIIALNSALVVLPAALFLRWKYSGSILARAMVGLGVCAVLATAFVPVGGKLPILNTFDGIGDASAIHVFTTIYPNILILLTLLSLLGLIGKGSNGLVQVWAIGLLLYLPIKHWLPFLSISNLDNIFIHLPVFIAGISMLIYLTLSSFGLFQLLSPLSRPNSLK